MAEVDRPTGPPPPCIVKCSKALRMKLARAGDDKAEECVRPDRESIGDAPERMPGVFLKRLRPYIPGVCKRLARAVGRWPKYWEVPDGTQPLIDTPGASGRTIVPG